MDFDFEPIDADNHYYEPLDAFTRHLDPKYKQRGVQVVTDERQHAQLLIGGRVNRFIPNPTFDPIIVPGCLDLLFRGQIPDDVDPRTLMQVEPLRPEYQDRDERVAVGRAPGPRRGVPVPDARVRRRRSVEGRHPGDDGEPRRVQPVAGGRLGLRLRAPPRHRADALARRSRSCARGARQPHRSRCAHRAHPPGTGSRRARHFTFARRSRARPRMGAPRRGVDPGRVPLGRQRLQRLHRDVGRFPELRGLRQGGHSRAGSWSPTGPSTTRSRRSSSTACSSAIPRCGSRASRTVPIGWRCS